MDGVKIRGSLTLLLDPATRHHASLAVRSLFRWKWSHIKIVRTKYTVHEFRAHRYRPTLRAKLSSAKRRSKKGAGKRARVLRSNCGQIDEQTVLSVVTGTDSSTFATPEAAAPDAPTSSCGAPSRPAARLELRR
eukprot:3499658-Pyramimonas_sp.AAC.1